MGSSWKYLFLGILLIQEITSEFSADPPPDSSTEFDDTVPTTPCWPNVYGYCEGDDWEGFYGMFVVGLGLCFAFFLCAGFLTFLVYFTCKRNRPSVAVHTTALPPIELSRPPPDFEEALKCSKVEYKLDIDDVPPPVYSSLKF